MYLIAADMPPFALPITAQSIATAIAAAGVIALLATWGVIISFAVYRQLLYRLSHGIDGRDMTDAAQVWDDSLSDEENEDNIRRYGAKWRN